MKTSLSILTFASLLLLSTACSDKKKEANANPSMSDTLHRVRQEKMTNPYSAVDISPMDMAYFPPDYPKRKSSDPTTPPPIARTIYSRPHLEGRHLFQDLLKYGEPWRLGANESTELQFYRDVTIQDKKVKAGRYVIYCLPQADQWTIVLNSNIDSWGLRPDSTKDLMRFSIPVQKTSRRVEYFTMIFEKTDSGTDLLMAWDLLEARLPIHF